MNLLIKDVFRRLYSAGASGLTLTSTISGTQARQKKKNLILSVTITLKLTPFLKKAEGHSILKKERRHTTKFRKFLLMSCRISFCMCLTVPLLYIQGLRALNLRQ